MPPLLELVERSRPADFKIFTGSLSPSVDGDRKVISCTASSSVVDLHGDEITAECVASMAEQALAKGMTIFLNHEYRIPEDAFGQTVAANTKIAADGVAELALQIEVDETNPRATQTYASIIGDPGKGRKGLRLGVSIGAQITDWEFRDAKKEWAGGIKIKGVDLLEASIVGIPANQRSWVQNAVKSLRKKEATPPQVLDEDDDLEEEVVLSVETTEETTEELELDADTPKIKCADCDAELAGEGELKHLGDGAHEFVPPVIEDASEEFLAAHPEMTATPLTQDQILNALGGTEDTPPSDDPVTSAPDAGDSRGDADEAVTDQAVQNALASATSIKVSAADGPVLTVVLATLESVASELRTTRSTLATVQTELAATVATRDQAVQDLADARQIIEVIAKLPLGRKTRFIEPITSFRQRFAGIYPEDFLRLIDERQDSPSG